MSTLSLAHAPCVIGSILSKHVGLCILHQQLAVPLFSGTTIVLLIVFLYLCWHDQAVETPPST